MSCCESKYLKNGGGSLATTLGPTMQSSELRAAQEEGEGKPELESTLDLVGSISGVKTQTQGPGR